MEWTSNVVLVTGGASGIGQAMAERFLAAGNEVIVCGRRESSLNALQKIHPKIHTRVCNVAEADERESLFRWVTINFPGVNVLVNNAGIQRRIALTEPQSWKDTRQEIAINFEAPVHLSQLFIPHLTQQKSAALLNVTSGLSFAPLANVPVYCATKAGLHSFTLSLRHQLAHTGIEVVEIIPPAVDTDLGGPGLHTFGVPLADFADSVFQQLHSGVLEIAYGSALKTSTATRAELNEIFKNMNATR